MSLWISNFLNISAFVNMKVIFAVINTTWAVVKIRPEKNSGLYGIWTHDLCNTAAVFHSASQWWWVKIPHRPEKFFSRPYFHYCSCSVYYTVKIAFILASLSAVQIDDFHIFTVVYQLLFGISVFLMESFLCDIFFWMIDITLSSMYSFVSCVSFPLPVWFFFVYQLINLGKTICFLSTPYLTSLQWTDISLIV